MKNSAHKGLVLALLAATVPACFSEAPLVPFDEEAADATGAGSAGEPTPGPATTGSAGDGAPSEETRGDSDDDSTGDVSTTGELAALESSSGGTTGVTTDYPSSPCELFAQDCAPGEKCMPFGDPSWMDTGCFPIDAETVAVGDACVGDGISGIDDCPEGALCYGGICTQLCGGVADGASCGLPAAECVSTEAEFVNLCLPGCDPLAQDCIAGHACYAFSLDFLCAPEFPNRPGVAGAPCIFINNCNAGEACVGQEVLGAGCDSEYCCTPFCDTGDVGSCDGESVCVQLGQGAFEDVGYCGNG